MRRIETIDTQFDEVAVVNAYTAPGAPQAIEETATKRGIFSCTRQWAPPPAFHSPGSNLLTRLPVSWPTPYCDSRNHSSTPRKAAGLAKPLQYSTAP